MAFIRFFLHKRPISNLCDKDFKHFVFLAAIQKYAFQGKLHGDFPIFLKNTLNANPLLRNQQLYYNVL